MAPGWMFSSVAVIFSFSLPSTVPEAAIAAPRHFAAAFDMVIVSPLSESITVGDSIASFIAEIFSLHTLTVTSGAAAVPLTHTSAFAPP